MNFEFWNDAIFNIYPNSIVVLKGTSLTGKECGLMWQGVRLLSSKQNMLSNSLIMVKSSSGLPSRIADAYIAIKSIHSLSIVQATQESIFERNEKHMFLQNATLSRTKIESCKFFGDLVLKDQYKGSNNGYSDFKNRTKIGIELINANVKIGGSGILGNLIKGGQLGISAVGSDVIIYNDELTGQMDYGVLYNGNNLYSKSLEVHCSKFHDLYRGMKILNKTKSSTIMKNKFLNTSGYGIEYISNQGGELKIGDSLQNNEFNNCNWAAIQCFDNGRFSNLTNNIIPNSQIFIKFNKIDNHVYASGIAISEPTAAGQNFGKVIVYKNQMGSQQPIGQGIVLKQIFGSNPTNPIVPISTNSIPYSSSFLISNNYVQFTNVLNPTYRGMWSENSPGQNFLMNDISCVGSGDWRPSSLRINDGPKNLVYQNSLHAGFGLQVTGIGLFSNYYCNSLNNCVTGIQLEWNYLRNAVSGPNAAHDEYKIHANKIININGRPNSFNNTISWGSDINVYNQAIDRNQWDFVSNNLPKISYLKKSALFPNGIVHQTKRQNPCDAGLIPMDSSILDTVFVEYQNDTNFVFKWKLMHSIARDYISGNTNQKVNNAGICKLVNIEKSIQNGKFEIADSLLNIYIPCNYIESDFKKVYEIWVSKNSISNLNQLPSSFYRLDTIWKDSLDFALDSLMSDSSCKIINQIELADSLINQLSKIASQNATLFNPASYPARAILYGTKHLLFSDSLVEFLPNITGNIESACTGYQNCEIQIFEDSGNFTGINTYTDSNGYFLFGGNQLKSLDSTKFYYLKSVLADSTIITSNSDYWKSLAYNGSWVFSCLKPIQLKNTTLNNLPKFYPNPGNSILTFDNLPENWYISIYNLAGQQIYAAKGSEIKFEFKHNLTQGIYSIQIKDTKNGKVTNEKYMVD
jgi:hypothetical protein